MESVKANAESFDPIVVSIFFCCHPFEMAGSTGPKAESGGPENAFLHFMTEPSRFRKRVKARLFTPGRAHIKKRTGWPDSWIAANPPRFGKEPSLGTKAVSLPLCGIATAVQNRLPRREFCKNTHGILDCAGRARATTALSS